MSKRVSIRGGQQVVPHGCDCFPPWNGARDREWRMKRDYNRYRDRHETGGLDLEERRERWLSAVRQSVLLVHLFLWNGWLVGSLGIPDAIGDWDNSIIGRNLGGRDLYSWRWGPQQVVCPRVGYKVGYLDLETRRGEILLLVYLLPWQSCQQIPRFCSALAMKFFVCWLSSFFFLVLYII